MKILPVLTVLVFTGCSTVASTAPLPIPAKPAPEPRPIAATPTAAVAPPATIALAQKIRQQAQLIEALISQNDALTAKLAATPPGPTSAVSIIPNPPTAPAPSAPPSVMPVSATTTAVAPLPTPELLLLPNADGVIDLTAVSSLTPPGEPTNPFVVRSVPPETTREISLHVGGIVAGPVPCAIINERLLLTGETIETFAVERIEPDAVFLRHGEHRIKLPVAEKPARVRLAL